MKKTAQKRNVEKSNKISILALPTKALKDVNGGKGVITRGGRL